MSMATTGQSNPEASFSVPYSPTSELDQAAPFGKTFDDFSGISLKYSDFSVGEVILIQIGNVLKDLQSGLYVT